jgi:hypothetical protein
MIKNKVTSLVLFLFIIGCNEGPIFEFTDEGDLIAPIITITHPADQSILADTVTISAYAFDDRRLSNVIVFLDSVPIITKIDTPFILTHEWITTDSSQATEDSFHTIYAIAEDASGNINQTKPIRVYIDNEDNEKPEGLFIYPFSGQTLAGEVNIIIEASDNEEVSMVNIFIEGNLVTGISEEPYTYLWVTNELPDDIYYEIHAHILDDSNNQTTIGPIAVLIDNNDPIDTTPPLGSIISPASGQTINGSVNISIEAYDSEDENPTATIKINQTILVDNLMPPHEYTWNTQDNPDGEYVINVTLSDGSQNLRILYPVFVTINNDGIPDITPPIVEIVSPAINQVISGDFEIDARASDYVGIDRVEFYIDDEFLQIATYNDTLYAYDIPTLNYPDGDHILYAVAYDFSQNQTQSQPFTFTIDNIDDESPSGFIIYPFSGQNVSGIETIQISALDNDSVAQVQLLIAGAFAGNAIEGENNFIFDWNTETASEDDQYQIIAIIRDFQGNSFNTAPIIVTVDNDSIPNEDFTPPIVSILYPVSGQIVSDTVEILGFATDNFGIEHVKIFLDGALLETIVEEPYSYLWNTTNLENHTNYVLDMVAQDIHGNQTAAQPIYVTIQNEYLVIEEFNLTEQVEMISLSWTAPFDAETYRISKDDFFLIELSETNFDDIVEGGIEHCYTISALNSMGFEGPLSETECGTATSPAATTSFSAHEDGNSITLLWNAVQNASSYNLIRNNVQVWNGDAITYTDSGLDFGVTYVYTLIALGSDGTDNTASDPLTVTTNNE